MICRNLKCAKEIPPGAVFCPWCGKKQKLPERKPKSRGNGLGTVYKLDNGKWCAQKTVGWITDPLPPDAPEGTVPKKRRQAVKKTFATKKDALAALPTMTAASRRPRTGNAIQRKGESVTLKELYDLWEPTHQKSRSTMNCYRSGFRLFASLWQVPMKDLTIDDLQDCFEESDAGRRTQENGKAALGLVYKYGIPRNAVPKDRNLSQFLRITEPGGAKRPGFSAEELELIRAAAAAGDPVAVQVLCHCYLGFRPTAFLQLKVSDYDPKLKAFTGGIKTEAGKNRTVTVSPKIQPYVDALVAAAGDGYVFGEAGKQAALPDYREQLYKLLQRCGIPNPVDENGRHRLTPHSCRHTFATLMKRVPGSDADKLALIGHTSSEQLRDYQDVPVEDLRKITDLL